MSKHLSFSGAGPLISKRANLPCCTTLFGHVLKVVGSCAQEKMGGVDAQPNITSMQHAQIIRDGAKVKLPGVSMGKRRHALNRNSAVTGVVRRVSPKPAGFGLIDARPKLRFYSPTSGMAQHETAGLPLDTSVLGAAGGPTARGLTTAALAEVGCYTRHCQSLLSVVGRAEGCSNHRFGFVVPNYSTNAPMRGAY